MHNEYGKLSGEEVVVNRLTDLLAKRGHEVVRFGRSSAEIPGKVFGQLQAFCAGIYNPFSRRRFGRFLDEHRPEVVHIHNLFPFISPSILPECGRRRVRTVMTLHNFRLLCPNALLMRNGQICHECLPGREWRCVVRNCERSLPKSIGYAARTAFARRSNWFLKHVDQYICLTAFQRDIHVAQGFPRERMSVIPNSAPPSRIGRNQNAATHGRRMDRGFIGYVGRVSPEKDVPTLLNAAKRLPLIPFKVAGSYDRMPELIRSQPNNAEFVGHLDQDELEEFYAELTVMAFTTRCYECFPTAVLEAMTHGIPVVGTRIGGLPEIVEEGQTGLLYEPGDPYDLAAKILRLWRDPALAARLGAAGRVKAQRDYSEQITYKRLMDAYGSKRAPSQE